MGCFSFICKKCGKPIHSNSVTGQQVHLFLLEDGHVRESMFGRYDSYGRVFGEQWRINDIAAIHAACWDGFYPRTRSDDDPEQGWCIAEEN